MLSVSAPLERVWAVLPAVFDSLAIPLTVFDVRGRVIGNEGFKLRRQLANAPLSRYLECGRSQMGQNADEYEITLAVTAKAVASGPEQTTLTTVVHASGAGLQFAGQSATCTTKGTLEVRLRQLLERALRSD